jgi:hypothetical protein
VSSPFIDRTFFQLDISSIFPYILSVGKKQLTKETEMIRDVQKSSLCFSFFGKFANMRKEQSFVIYPVSSGDKYIKIQSAGRYGFIDKEGRLVLTSKNETYPNSQGLILEVARKTAKTDLISKEEMGMIRECFKNEADSFFGNSVCEVAGNDSDALKGW